LIVAKYNFSDLIKINIYYSNLQPNKNTYIAFCDNMILTFLAPD